MKRLLRVGIIGAGMMGEQHTEAIRRIPGTEVAALADVNPARAQELCDRLQIPKWYDNYLEMIEKEHLDVVHNCTPNYMHFEINKALIERGIPVYSEKPLGMNSAETGELCLLAKEKNVKTAVNFNYRQNAIIREMHERICTEREKPDNKWGRTFLVHGTYIQDWMLYDTDYSWRCEKDVGGESRAVVDIGSHWFDAVRYITGVGVKRVNAKLITVYPQRKKFKNQALTFGTASGDDYELVDVENEDAAMIMLEFEDGSFGDLLVSQVSAGHKNDFEINVDGSNYSMSWNQENTDKIIINDRVSGRTTRYAGPDMLSAGARNYGTLPSGHPVGWQDALRNAINGFYDNLRDGTPGNFATFVNGDYVTRVVEACLRSAKSGQWEELQLVKGINY